MFENVQIGSLDSFPQLVQVANASWGGSDPGKYIVVGLIAGGVLLLILVMVLLKHRRHMAALRYQTLESLARQGAITPQQLQEHLDPQRRRWRALVLLAWLGLIVGISLLIASGFERGQQQDELILAGAIVSFVSTAGLATPIMLREMRKHGAY